MDLDERRRGRGRRRWLRIAAPIGIAAGAVAFFGYAANLPESASDSGSSAAAPARGAQVEAAPAITMSSGLDYSLGTLDQSRKQDTAEPLAASGAADISGAQTDGLSRLRAGAALLECLNAIAQENGGAMLSAESVDYARFDGAPAVVIRFTATNGEWVWASGADCGLPGGGADTLGKLPVR